MNGMQKVIKIFAICLAIFIILNIVRGILWGLFFFSNINGINKEPKATFSEIYSNVNKIDIDTISSDVIIKHGTEFRVDASNMENDFSSKNTNGTLKIKENKWWFWSNNIGGTITIYVPEEIENLKIDAGAGKIEIEELDAEILKIDQGAGKLTITDSEFQTSNINGGAGEIKVENSTLNNLKLDSGVGKVDIEGKITGKIECGIGEMNIKLQGNKDDYYISAEKGIGSIKIDGEERTSYRSTVEEIPRYSLRLEGGIGAINVRFQEDTVQNNRNQNINNILIEEKYKT